MPAGAVTQELIDFHVDVATGGAALTTVAYCAVSMGGRVSRDTMVFDRGSDRRPAAPHRRRPRRGGGGLGPARPRRAGGADTSRRSIPTLAPSTRFSAPAMGRCGAPRRDSSTRSSPTSSGPPGSPSTPASTRSRSTSGTTTCSARSSAPTSTSADDELGGSIENRLASRAGWSRRSRHGGRRPRSRCSPSSTWPTACTRACGSRRASRSAALLEADGHLDALELTGGSSLLNGMYFFRGDVPDEGVRRRPGPGGGARACGCSAGGSSRSYPFEEGFFLPVRPPVPRRAVDAARPARRHQRAGHHRRPRWTRASSSWPWPGPCCASPTWSTKLAAGRPTRASASTATSACRPSTPAPAACCEPKLLPEPNVAPSSTSWVVQGAKFGWYSDGGDGSRQRAARS